MCKKVANNLEKFCLVICDGPFFNENPTYACYSCETTGSIANPFELMHAIDKGVIRLNGSTFNVNTDKAWSCPNCGNKHVLTNAIGSKAGVSINEIDIINNVDLFQVELAFSIYRPYVLGDSDVLKTYYKGLEGMVRYLSNTGDFDLPVHITNQFGEASRFSLRLDKIVNEFTIYLNDGQNVELFLPIKRHYTKEWVLNYSLLPLEVKQILAQTMYEQLTPYVREKFDYGEILSADEVLRLAILIRFPVYELLPKEFNTAAIAVSYGVLEDFGSGSTSDQLANVLVPKSTKKVRSKLFASVLPSNKPLSNAWSTLFFTALTTHETMNNLLDFMKDNEIYVEMGSQRSFHDNTINEFQIVSHLSLVESLYELLEEGSLDKYVNSVVSGRAFVNEGQKGQKRAIRSVKELIISTMHNAVDMLKDTCQQIHQLKQYEQYFVENLQNEVGEFNEIELELFKTQLKNVRSVLNIDKKYKSLKNLHDHVFAVISEVLLENRVYDYDAKALELEGTILEYEFKMPKESLEIVELGTDLEICVGSYNTDVINGEILIVGAYLNDKPVLCIEIDDNYTITQVKMRKNKLLDSSKLFDADIIEALDAYIQEKGLLVDTADLVFTNIECTEVELEDNGWEEQEAI